MTQSINDPVPGELADIASKYAAAQAEIGVLNGSIAALQQQVKAAASSLVRPQHFGVNLESISYYNRMPLFADAMLQSNSGDPTADTQVLIFSQATANYAGAYAFRCNGQPTLGIVNSFGTISNQTYDTPSNTTTATITVTTDDFAKFAAFGAPQLGLSITNVAAGKVSNVQVWRPGCATDGSQRFTPAVLKAIAPFDTIRFMDALATNGSTVVNWSDRPLPTDRNYTGRGMCYEDVFSLCRACGKAPWVCLPTQATADYLSQFIALTKAQAGPGPVYIEWGNEVWNSAFPQWKQAMALAAADKSLAYDGTGDPNILIYRWMGKQAVAIGKAACAAYGVTDIRLTPIRPILAGQWGNPDVLKYALDYVATQVGPPNQYIYAIAIAPYATLSGNMWGRIQSGDPTVTEAQIPADYAANGVRNSSLADPGTAAFVAQAKQYGLHTRAYEFGFDSGQAQQCVAQKNAAAHDPGIGPVLAQYVNNWWAAGCEGLNWYTLTGLDSSSGQWGLTADAYDLTTPKYVAATQAAQATMGSH